MKTIPFLAYILSVVVFFSYSRCMGPDSPPPRYPPGIKKSYIQNFIPIDTLVLVEQVYWKIEGNEIDRSQAKWMIYSEDTIFEIEDNITLFVLGEWKEKYNNGNLWYYTQTGYDEKYCPLSGDTAYNREEIYPGLKSYPIAIRDTLESITIFTNADYDAGHPAGSDVSGYFSVYFENPYLVVQNHYNQPEGGYRLIRMPNDYPYIMTGGNLGEMSFTDKPFIGNTYICVLEHAPTVTGAYTFTVRLKKTTGEILEKTSILIKIKGGGS